jgi:hypothetical protein
MYVRLVGIDVGGGGWGRGQAMCVIDFQKGIKVVQKM